MAAGEASLVREVVRLKVEEGLVVATGLLGVSIVVTTGLDGGLAEGAYAVLLTAGAPFEATSW